MNSITIACSDHITFSKQQLVDEYEYYLLKRIIEELVARNFSVVAIRNKITESIKSRVLNRKPLKGILLYVFKLAQVDFMKYGHGFDIEIECEIILANCAG